MTTTQRIANLSTGDAVAITLVADRRGEVITGRVVRVFPLLRVEHPNGATSIDHRLVRKVVAV